MATEDFVYVDLRCPRGHMLRQERTNIKDNSIRIIQLKCRDCGKDVKFQIKSGRVNSSYIG